MCTTGTIGCIHPSVSGCHTSTPSLMACGWKHALSCAKFSIVAPVARFLPVFRSTMSFLPRFWISCPRCHGLTARPAAILSFQSNPKRLASMFFNVQPTVARLHNVKNLSLWNTLPVFCRTRLTVRFSLKRSSSHYAPSLLVLSNGTNQLTASINLLFTFY